MTIILVVVIVVALLGFVIWQNRKDACETWQRQYEELVDQGGGGGILDYINLGPLAELRDQRPEGCHTPAAGEANLKPP